MQRYIKKGTRTKEVDEESMTLAINDVMEGRLSYRKAALKYNVKASTLESRVKRVKAATNHDGTPLRTFQSKFTSLQVFSSEEEVLLNDYISTRCKMHYGLTKEAIRKLAYDYAKEMNLKYPPTWDENKTAAGEEWLRKYRERNENLRLRKPEKTSAARSFAFNKTAVKEFYNNFSEVLQRHNFAPDRIFNFDESGVSTVLDTPKVLAPRSQKQVGQIVSAERGELVTFGGIISASGNTIPPLFIFPRVNYRDHFLEGAPEGSIGAATKSGWINSEIFVLVLKHIQKFSLSSKDHPILLLCDNHESHISLQAITYARDNGIILLSFPPHTSHRLQPLDVGVFGPFKSKLKIAFNNWHMSNPGKTISIYNIPKLVKLAYFESFTAKNITSGFEKPGIWPFNEMAFSDDDYAPINVYSSNNPENLPPNLQTSPRTIESQLFLGMSSTDINEDNLLLPSVTRELSPSLLQNLEDITTVTGLCEPSTSTPSSLQNLQVVTTTGSQSCEPSTSTPNCSFQNIQDVTTICLQLGEPSTSAVETIRPEVVRPYPTAVRTKKTNKGRKPGKSRTDTPEKNELEERHHQKELKKKEQERKARAKEMKRNLLEVHSRRNKKTKRKWNAMKIQMNPNYLK